MKGDCDSYAMSNNIHFINYWKAMVLTQYINETCVYPQDKEMFKIKKDTAPNLVREIFPLSEENRYKLQNRIDFTIQTVKSVPYGQESLR